MADEFLEIQKRHTLNWLIQGSAQHAGLTLHHHVRDELNALDAKLLPCYDEFALIVLLQYWRGMSVMFTGRPARFWKRAGSDRTHPFFGHPLLSRYGGMLAEASKQRALARCREKGYSVAPLVFSFRALALIQIAARLEAPYRSQLLQLAKRTGASIWGIPTERFDVELGDGKPLHTEHLRGEGTHAQVLRSCVIGYSNIERQHNQLVVAAKGISWQMLAKELIKGTAELICLHGLANLSDTIYDEVIQATDRIEFEPWLLQSGGELWRRFLTALPDGCLPARVLMNLARLPAAELHSTLELVIQESSEAKGHLSRLAE